MPVFVALLRGVNVGGRGIVSMKDVQASFERIGFARVQTYINSGNVVFEAKGSVRTLERKAEAALAADCGIGSKVVVKTLAEYEAIVNALPAEWVDGGDFRVNVLFLRHTVDSGKVLDELGAVAGVDETRYTPGAVFWRAPRADERSQYERLSRRPIYQEMTARNRNTTRKLLDLMRARI